RVRAFGRAVGRPPAPRRPRRRFPAHAGADLRLLLAIYHRRRSGAKGRPAPMAGHLGSEPAHRVVRSCLAAAHGTNSRRRISNAPGGHTDRLAEAPHTPARRESSGRSERSSARGDTAWTGGAAWPGGARPHGVQQWLSAFDRSLRAPQFLSLFLSIPGRVRPDVLGFHVLRTARLHRPQPHP